MPPGCLNFARIMPKSPPWRNERGDPQTLFLG